MVTTKRAARRPLVWCAGSDKVAHAHELTRLVTRTLCGYRIVDVRLSWPPERRCPTCVERAGDAA